MSVRLISWMVLMLCICSCSQQYYYQHTETIADAQWSYEDTLSFEVDIADTTVTYDLMLDINHSKNYAYQNIYVKIFTTFPDGKELAQQVPIDFADGKGRWYGKCGSSSCHLRVMLQEQAHFNQIGTHSLEVVQYMRISPLEGIQAVDLLVDKKRVTRSIE